MKFLIVLLPYLALTTAAYDVRKYFRIHNNQFSAKFFYEVVQKNPGKSVVVSGYSVLAPLSALTLGSTGSTHTELLDVLDFRYDESVKLEFEAGNRQLKSLEGVVLKVANKVYVADGFQLNKTFAQESRNVFNVNVENINFANYAFPAEKINRWVEDNTNNRIKNLVSDNDFNQRTKAVLLNAVYFKGNWQKQFLPSGTQYSDFHVNTYKTVKVPTMYQGNVVRYGHSNELKAKLLELPFEGGKTSMLFVVPDEVDGLAYLENKLLSQATLDRAVNEMTSKYVDVYIPKFKFETSVDVKEALKNVGVKKLFDPFVSRLDHVLATRTKLNVDKAKQKAYVNVNEGGVEAAVATEVVADAGSSGGSAPVYLQFKADRPFFFTLKAEEITLFSGVYYG